MRAALGGNAVAGAERAGGGMPAGTDYTDTRYARQAPRLMTSTDSTADPDGLPSPRHRLSTRIVASSLAMLLRQPADAVI